MSSPPADAAATLRAAAEVFVPGLESGDTAGAPEVAAERFLVHYLDIVVPGLSQGAADLLDSMAAQASAGQRFADLDLAAREKVLETLRSHDIADLRALPDLIAVLTYAAVYGEWTGQDERGALVRRPLGWDLTGFPGPSDADPYLLREPEAGG